MGGTGAVEAFERRMTAARQVEIDEARLEKLREKLRAKKGGQRQKPRKSTAFASVINFNETTGGSIGAAPTATKKRSLGSPHKSGGRRGFGTGNDGRQRPTSKGMARGLEEEVELPTPTNGLEFTPGSALKIMQEAKKPGIYAKAMAQRELVPVAYPALMKMKDKAKKADYRPP